jgi:aspartyl-tRNA(Asn)/glutamyl-tRNA(Gln) amidotransferase subunit A
MSTLLSRRRFIETTVASAASSWISSGMRAESKSRESAEPSSAGDLTALSLTEASDLARRRKVSPVELTNACLARIEQFNPRLNAFITVTNDLALAQARAAEHEIQHGRWRGPLHGIPIALKDLFDTSGVRTTAASAVFKDRIPAQDAEVVRRLKVAGAVLLGKTNMVEFAYGSNATVSFFGPVHNPWNLERNPGGSSSGSAAATAAGLCYGALGSDTAGSIRQPASLCGVVGLMPTYGLVSTAGVIPLSWSNDHVGPLTRTVEDNALMLQVLAGYDAADANSIRASVPDYRPLLRRSTSSIRVGVPRDFFFDDLDEDVDISTKKALGVIQMITAGLRDVTLPYRAGDLESARGVVRAAEAYVYHTEWVTKTPELYQPETLLRIRAGADVTAPGYIRARREEAEARHAIERVFRKVDVLVTPTVPIPPHSLAELGKDVTTSMRLGSTYAHNTSPFNVYGIPSISVPCGFTKNGLPIGLQISGAKEAEAVVFQVAAAYEKVTGWKGRPHLAL